MRGGGAIVPSHVKPAFEHAAEAGSIMRAKIACKESEVGWHAACWHSSKRRVLRYRGDSNTKGLQAKRHTGSVCVQIGISRICHNVEPSHAVQRRADGRAVYGTGRRAHDSFLRKAVPLSHDRTGLGGEAP